MEGRVKLPRAACPVCHGEVALRRSGAFREHLDKRHHLYGTGQGELVPNCPASGKTIAEAQAQARSPLGAR